MAIRAGAIEAALSDLVPERLVADFEESSCLRAVPPHSLENLFYSCRLGSHGRFFGDLLESKALASGPRGGLILGRNESGRGKSRGFFRSQRDLFLYEELTLQDHEPPNHILELANISRPAVFLEKPHRLRRDSRCAAIVLLAEAAQEVPDERWDFFPARSQWGNGNRDHIEPIVQILPKLAVGHEHG